MAWSDLIQVLVARLLLLTVVVDLHGILASPSISGQSATIVNGGAASATAIDTRTDSVQQYYIEHTIGQKDASAAFKQMAKELINKPKPAWCQECTQTIVRYCLDHRMLHDHCCCDSGHARDQLPWLPHTCYVGDNCKPNMKSCMQYTEIRECCCDRIMAKQWSRSSASSWHRHERRTTTGVATLAVVILTALVRLV